MEPTVAMRALTSSLLGSELRALGGLAHLMLTTTSELGTIHMPS